jgi:putative nucleotidyltransferase with HDIG domain
MPAEHSAEVAATSTAHPLIGQVLDLLRHRRGVHWLVGGYVRDILMGRPTHDLDLVVEDGAMTLARAIADRFGGAFYPLDEARDIGRAILSEPQPVLTVDVSRLQGGDLAADLAQRDFTINAMALALNHEPLTLIDPHGGRHDIAGRWVRAVSESAFRDDPIRCLRAVRLAAELEFRVEEQTQAWVRRDASLVSATSPERVQAELVRILDAEGADLHLRHLSQLGLLPLVLPEVADLQGVLQSLPHTLDVFDHTLMAVRQLELVLRAVEGDVVAGLSTAGDSSGKPAPSIQKAALTRLATGLGPLREDLHRHLSVSTSADRTRGMLLRWAALLHDVGKPKTRTVENGGRVRFIEHDAVGAALAAQTLRRLRFTAVEARWVESIVRQHMRPSALAREPVLTRRAVYRFFRDAGAAGVDTCLLALADHLATWGQNLDTAHWSDRVDGACRLFDSYFRHGATRVSPRPLVSGTELQEACGLDEGPRIGVLLEAIREAQAAGEVSTRDEALALARKVISGEVSGAAE